MKSIIIISLLVLTAFTSASFLKEGVDKAHYAVLVAGSNGYWNYRHQADIFHAYHVLINNGMPKENIILFAYDDIANNSENPFPGKVFNQPDKKGEGKDYYAGVTIDYKGKDVTPENFLAVLEGNEEALKGIGSGRVLKSTSNDNVFINFTDHGAPGLVGFPSAELYADDLIKTLKTMNEKKMYNELVFYMEACESGSMFQDILPKDINIFATTAANASESSWGCYCGSEAVVNGKNIGSCLGDLYSVVWMEDTDQKTTFAEETCETLQDQFDVVLKKVTKSHPGEWGTETFSNECVNEFQGNATSPKYSFEDFKNDIYGVFHPEIEANKLAKQTYLDFAKINSTVNSRDIKLDYLSRKAQTSQNDVVAYQELQAEVHHREVVDTIFREFAVRLELQSNIEIKDIDFKCLRNSINYYKETCHNFSEYTLKYVNYIYEACRLSSEYTIGKTLYEICTSQ